MHAYLHARVHASTLVRTRTCVCVHARAWPVLVHARACVRGAIHHHARRQPPTVTREWAGDHYVPMGAWAGPAAPDHIISCSLDGFQSFLYSLGRLVSVEPFDKLSDHGAAM